MYVKSGDRVVILHGHPDHVGKLGQVITVIGVGAIVEIEGNRAGFPLAWLRPTSEQTSERSKVVESLESGTLPTHLKMFGSCSDDDFTSQTSEQTFKQKPTHWTGKYYVERGWFYRYYWMQYCDRQQKLVTKHKHIRGGNICSKVAQCNRQLVNEAIAAGWLPHQIVAMIAGWPKGKRRGEG